MTKTIFKYFRNVSLASFSMGSKLSEVVRNHQTECIGREHKVVDKTAYVNYTRTDTFLNKR